jgi:hypothetical protein
MHNDNWRGTITLLSPLSHNDDVTLGTDAKFRRLTMLVDGRPEKVPVYSGNACRGILRRLAARDYLDRLGIEKVPDALYYCLFCGGALQKGSTQDKLDIGGKRKLREMVPFLSLFGTAYANQIMPGKLNVGMAVPVARETAAFTGRECALSVWDMLTEVFYTRRDDLEDKAERGDDDQATQMKYSVECLTPGTVLVHEFVVEDGSEIELSCFGHLMRLFEANPILGGRSAIGHGKVQLAYEPAWPDPAPYLAAIEERREEMKQFVEGMGALLR